MVAARTQTEHKNNKNTTKKTLQSLSHLDTAICALKETETKQTLQEIRLLDLVRKWLLFFSLIFKNGLLCNFYTCHFNIVISKYLSFIMKVKRGIGLNQADKKGGQTHWVFLKNEKSVCLQIAIVLKSSCLCHFESESDLWTNYNARWFFIVLVSLVNTGFLWHII